MNNPSDWVILVVFVILAGVTIFFSERQIGANRKAADEALTKFNTAAASFLTNQKEEVKSTSRAWVTLEQYFALNLNQNANIYQLSARALVAGFIIIACGLLLALLNLTTPFIAALPVTAGVLTEFVGATFLVIYRSTNEQAKEYLKTLERIHSIEVALQIVADMPQDNMPDSATNKTKSSLVQLLFTHAHTEPTKVDDTEKKTSDQGKPK